MRISKTIPFMLFILFAETSLMGQTTNLNLMPEPAHVTVGQGKLVIDNSFSVALDGYQEPRLVKGAERLTRTLSRQTGIPFRDVLATDASKAKLEIHVDHAGEEVQSVREDESYQLEVTPQQAKLSAPTPV